MKNLFIPKIILVALMIYFYSNFIRYDNYFSFLDYINLCFHEAGHVFLGFLGETIGFMGGTISQIFWPTFITIYFYKTGQIFSSKISLYWVGENFLNISIYIADAQKQELPLVGGGEHDWAYLLNKFQLIKYTDNISKAVFILGSLIMFYSIYLIIKKEQTQ
ncbi:MAG: hypothetical protein AB1602_01060 [Elusimicrobiota bacterium]